MEIRFKKIHPEAVAPAKAHPSDAGFDLTAVTVSEDRIRGIVTYGTGIAVEIPEGYVGLLFPRSSVYKYQLSLANSVGVIDSGYRGEVMFKYRVVQPHIRRFSVGERVGQMIILPYPEIAFTEAQTLEETERAEGGFGSTGQ
jgi:dUTP pyrophosphatase